MAGEFIKGIIGDGFLTEVILTAFTRQIGISPEDTYVLAKTSGRCQELMEQYNVHAVQNSMVFVPPAKLLILTVELEDSIRAMKQIFDKVSEDALIISLVPGLSISQIEKFFPEHMVIRMYMNSWIVNGYGVSTYTVGSYKPEEAGNIARALLISLGETIEVESEEELEIVGELILGETLYAYIAVKSLIDSAKEGGLSLNKSREVVMKILTSSATAVSDSDAVTESVLERSYHQQGTFLEKSKIFLEKYNIMDNFQKACSAPLDAKDLIKFRYR